MKGEPDTQVHPEPPLFSRALIKTFQVTLLVSWWQVLMYLFPADLCGCWRQRWNCAKGSSGTWESVFLAAKESMQKLRTSDRDPVPIHRFKWQSSTSRNMWPEARRHMEEQDLPLPAAANYSMAQTTSRNHTWIAVLRSHLGTNHQICSGVQRKPGV